MLRVPREAGTVMCRGARDAGAQTLRVPRPTPASAAAWLTGVTYGLLTLQAVTLTGRIIDEADGPANGPAAKPYHVALLALGLVLLRRGRVVRWRPEMAVYFGVTAASTLAAYLAYGVKPFLANVVVAAYAATVAATLGLMGGTDAVLRGLRWAAAVVLVAVCVKLVLYRDLFLTFFAAPDGHPMIPGFFGGGPNLEASWVAAAGLFFLRSAWCVPYTLVSLVVSVLYVSRVGMLINLAVLVTALGPAGVRWWRRRATGPRRVLGAGVMAAGLVAACALVLGSAGRDGGRGGSGAADGAPTGLTDYVVQRFATVGEDKGSQGRVTLWTAAATVFAEHPWGVGQGNAMEAVARAAGGPLPEDNLHNQFLQHLVETGPQGLLAYVLLAGLTWRRAVVTRGRDPLVLYCATYFLLSAVQFRGADALLWFVYGLQAGAAFRAGGDAPHAAPAAAGRARAPRALAPA